jgi:general secretion pathway protein D
MKSTILRFLVLLAFVASHTSSPGWAQMPPPPLPPEDDFDEPIDNFGPPPDYSNPPPGTPSTPPPPPMESGSSFSSPPSSGGFGSGSSSGRSATKDAKRPSRLKLADAQPEDFTDENFPELIESFDYPNADIRDVINAIAELTGKNFIIDNNVSGKITIVAPTKITVAEAWKAFLSALAINNFTIVPSGKFLKIKNARQAQKDSIEIYSGSYYPNAEQMITRIAQIKHISAEELQKTLLPLLSNHGDIKAYGQTNSLIISDFGSNIERLMKIVTELDRPGFEEQLAVIPIRFAKAREMADLVTQIINKESGSQKGQNRFNTRIPRFRAPGQNGQAGAEQLSMVAPDERTNSLIVLGNKTGIEKIRDLVKQLDIRRSPEESGGVFVYYVQHGEAEKIAQTLNGIAGDNRQRQGGANGGGPGGAGGAPPPVGFLAPEGNDGAAMFGAEVKITPDKPTNSLIITASKQDYEVIKNILSKIDVPRDQVYVEAVIVDLQAGKTNTWSIDFYKFEPNTNGAGRAGFRSSESLGDFINPSGDRGAVLGFGSGDKMTINIPNLPAVEITSIVGFLKFVTQNTDSNVLSTPKLTAMNNEEAEIEVGERVPVAANQNQNPNGSNAITIERENATIKLKLTPFISPQNDMVRMKVEQSVSEVSNRQVTSAATLAANSIATSQRSIKTHIAVPSGDTAVLGGLTKDEERVNITKVPILGDIPILGWLFKSQKTETQKRNLVVFLTPKIVRSTSERHQVVDVNLERRVEFVKENLRGKDPYGRELERLPRLSEAGAKAQDNNDKTTDTKSVIDETLQTL